MKVLNGACDNGWCYVANSSERYHVSFIYICTLWQQWFIASISHSASVIPVLRTNTLSSIPLGIVPPHKVSNFPSLRI